MVDESSTSVYDDLLDSGGFKETLDELLEELVMRDLGEIENDTPVQVDEYNWTCSFLALSDDDAHKKQALTYAVLLYVLNRGKKEEPRYRRLLFLILNRLGNLPAIQNFEDMDQEDLLVEVSGSSDMALFSELGITDRKYDYGDFYLTDFQKRIWDAIQNRNHIAISGPTSSGKSFIIRKYLSSLYDQTQDSDKNFEAVYVVPTKALITEVQTELRQKLSDEITVANGVHFENDDYGDFILVLTPERCINLLDYDDTDFDFDLIFLDEIQNLEGGGRGVLFGNIIENMNRNWSDTRIITAGPYLDEPGEVLSEITTEETESITTLFTPVIQIENRMHFDSYASEIDIKIESPIGEPVETSVKRPTGFSKSTSQKGKAAKFIQNFGSNSQNLVYAHRTDSAEHYAEEIANENRLQEKSEDLQDLIDFLSTNIHEEYTLVKSLERGVAFHHGKVPDVARNEIESLYRDGELHTLVCTPTLLQGVNLPAEKILVIKPKKARREGPDEYLSKFELKNLTGRVGRTGSRSYGTIYYIENEHEDYYEKTVGEDPTKSVQSATTKILDEDLPDILHHLGEEDISSITDDGLRYTLTLLRNKYIKYGGDEVESYLERQDVDSAHKNEIISILMELDTDLSIPPHILRKNPTLDPLLQDKLYKSIELDPDMYVIDLYGRDFFETFERTTKQLNRIFKFAKDSDFGVLDDTNPADVPAEAVNLTPLRINSFYWLQGRTYRDIIERMINNDKTSVDKGDENKAVREVMKLINHDTTYLLAKHYKLLSDIMSERVDVPDYMETLDQKLELGHRNPIIIELMSRGVNRSVAASLDIPRDIDDVDSYLRSKRNGFDPIVRRDLENNGII